MAKKKSENDVEYDQRVAEVKADTTAGLGGIPGRRGGAVKITRMIGGGADFPQTDFYRGGVEVKARRKKRLGLKLAESAFPRGQ